MMDQGLPERRGWAGEDARRSIEGGQASMTLAGFVRKNTFRNPRRSLLTVLSIAVSLLLLTLMMAVWRAFYVDQGSQQSAQRLLIRHRVSLANFLPKAYAQRN